MPEVYEFLEAERIKYAIRLPANQVLQSRIGYLLTRPVGRPPHHVRQCHASFSYQAGSWSKPRRVIAKVEWYPEELYPRVGFIVTNMSRPAERVVAFYNKRGTCEQWIKEGKGAIKWTRLSCRTVAANAVRLQLHALAYNLGNFLRTLATPEPIKDWSLTSLKEKLIKIGAKVVSHGRYVAFQMADPTANVPGILRLIAELRPQRQRETFDSHAFKSNLGNVGSHPPSRIWASSQFRKRLPSKFRAHLGNSGDRNPIRVSVGLAPKHVGRKEPLMQLPSILQGESRTRLLQGFLATVVIGFGWGGWTLASTARETAAKSAATAIVAALAPMCADKFRQAPDATANMAELKKISSWMQDSYIEKGGWATFPGMTSPDPGVARACASPHCSKDRKSV